MEHLGRSLPQQLKQVAGSAAPVHVHVAEERIIFKNDFLFGKTNIILRITLRHPLVECEGKDKPGGGADDHQEVAGSNGHQDCVGWGHHLGSINVLLKNRIKEYSAGNVLLKNLNEEFQQVKEHFQLKMVIIT